MIPMTFGKYYVERLPLVRNNSSLRKHKNQCCYYKTHYTFSPQQTTKLFEAKKSRDQCDGYNYMINQIFVVKINPLLLDYIYEEDSIELDERVMFTSSYLVLPT